MTDDGSKTFKSECPMTCGLRDAIDRGFADMRSALSESAHDRADLRREVEGLKAGRDKPSEPDLALTTELRAKAIELEALGVRVHALDAKVDRLIDVADRAEAWWKRVTANKYAKALAIAVVLYIIRYLESHGASVADVAKGVLP